MIEPDCEICALPNQCPVWTSHDDIGGEGEHTFYHECRLVEGHSGAHSCMGHPDPNSRTDWDSCSMEWF